jgi:hypothetical protein
MMDGITKQDIEFLLEAVDGWEKGIGRNAMLGGLLGAMMGPKDEDGEVRAAKFRREVEEENAKHKTARERAIVIKAKLIMLRDSRAADELFSAARS